MEMSGHRPSRNWEGPKKAGAKSRGRTRRFFCFSTGLYLAVVRVLIAIALLLGTANASKIAEVKDACGGTHFVNPDTPETSKEKSEREKWMGRVHFSRIVFEGARLSPAELNQVSGELRKRKTIGLEGLSEGLEQVRDEFQQRGFFQVQVTPVFKVISGTKCYHNASARFRVNTGRRYRLKEITFSDARNSSVDELRKAFPLETGEIFNTAKVRIGLEGLRKAYIKRGYVDFTAVPDTKINEDESIISLNLDIDEGKVFHVRQIGVAGLTDERFQQFYALFP